jgi:hypothetical protein
MIPPRMRRIFRRIHQLAKRAGRWRLRWVLTNFDAQHLGAEYAYETITRHRAYAPWAHDREFFTVYRTARLHTLVSVDRCYELWDLIHNLGAVKGAVIEIGGWRRDRGDPRLCPCQDPAGREDLSVRYVQGRAEGRAQ